MAIKHEPVKKKTKPAERLDDDLAVNMETGEINTIDTEADEKEISEGPKRKRRVVQAKEKDDSDVKENSPYEKITIWLERYYEIRFNELTGELEFRHSGEIPWKVLTKRQQNDMLIEMVMAGFSDNKLDTRLERVLNSSMYVPTHHPVRHYFETLEPWDGKYNWVNKLAETVSVRDVAVEYKKTDGTEVKTTINKEWPKLLHKWLMAAAVTGAHVSGAQGYYTNPVMMVFTGAQGRGKTTWQNNLCPLALDEYRYTGHIEPKLTDNLTCNRLAEKFILNIDDQLDAIFGKDFSSIKSIITCADVNNRKAYAKDAPKRPRICNFVGSVNKKEIFTDTENRRYMCIPAEKFDYGWKREHMDNVWAQVWADVQAGKNYRWDADDFALFTAIAALYRDISTEEEILQRYYRPAEESEKNAPTANVHFLTSGDLLVNLRKLTQMNLNKWKMSQALQTLGFGEPVSKRINNGLPRKVYVMVALEENTVNN